MKGIAVGPGVTLSIWSNLSSDPEKHLLSGMVEMAVQTPKQVSHYFLETVPIQWLEKDW